MIDHFYHQSHPSSEELDLFREKVLKNYPHTVHLFANAEALYKGPPRLALTLDGIHQIEVKSDKGKYKICESHKGEAYFFSPGFFNRNTGLLPRHVVTCLFNKSSTQLNFVQHNGKVDQPASLKIYKIEKSLDTIGKNLLDSLCELSSHSKAESRAIHLVRALLETVLIDIDCPLDSSLSKAQYTWGHIQSYLEENYQTSLVREDVAKVFGLSPNYVSTLCRRQTGETYSQVLTKIRLEYACRALENSKLNITEIAYQCGFEDPGYFSRVFKKYHEVSPGQFRWANVGVKNHKKTK